MPDRRTVRFLAPLALVVFAVLLVIVVASAGGGGSKASSATGGRRGIVRSQPRPKPTRYTVRSSDTSLASIARKTGVPTDRLLALNRDLDPQALSPGQQIKLR